MEKFRSHSQSHKKPVTLLKANFYKPSYLLNQGTKEMDVIVQVKFFVVVVVVFLIHLKLFAIVSAVTDVMFWNQFSPLTIYYSAISYWWLCYLTVCSGRMNSMFTKIITQTQTNAWTTLTIVVKMPPVPTPKGPSTVVANQGTLEMATTVQVGSWNSCLVFR